MLNSREWKTNVVQHTIPTKKHGNGDIILSGLTLQTGKLMRVDGKTDGEKTCWRTANTHLKETEKLWQN